MKEIMLTKGKVALIDDGDFELLNQFNWSAEKDKHTYYAVARVKIDGKSTRMRMHRFLMMPSADVVIDHRDRNGLNNQRHNLRQCTSSQNNANRKAAGLSKYKGVCKTTVKRVNKSGTVRVYTYWQASIQEDGKSKILGRFKIETEAALAYNEAAVRVYGQFANLNVIEEPETSAIPSMLIAEYDPEVGAIIVQNGFCLDLPAGPFFDDNHQTK